MTVQNETKWLIQIIQSNYPTAWPSDLVRRNLDESVTLDTPESPVHEAGVELKNYNAVSVSTGSVNRELYGTTPQYRVETQLDVRVEGMHEDEFGQISGDDEFKTLVRYVQEAINDEVVYPDVNTGDEDVGRITYLDLSIINENDLSSESKDVFRSDFTVRMRGNANL